LLKNKIKIDYEDKKGNNTLIRIQGLVIEKPVPIEIICEKDNQSIVKLEVPIEKASPTVEQITPVTMLPGNVPETKGKAERD
jgi:hypothetical protein